MAFRIPSYNVTVTTTIDAVQTAQFARDCSLAHVNLREGELTIVDSLDAIENALNELFFAGFITAEEHDAAFDLLGLSTR